MKKQNAQALQLEKQTLTAWAQILHRKGMIDSARLGRMITLIAQMTVHRSEQQILKSGS